MIIIEHEGTHIHKTAYTMDYTQYGEERKP